MLDVLDRDGQWSMRLPPNRLETGYSLAKR